jgi:rhomboid protease GluP
MHVLFNLLALGSIGPGVEQIFGGARTLFLYVATGVAANVPTFALGVMTVQIGASGAIMGLIGIAAGWGQRDGTAVGRTVRNQMLKWLAYTTLFGFLVNADHVAHWTGFLVGGVAGWLSRPRSHGGGRSSLDTALGILGLVAALACTALVMLGPRVTPLPPGLE